MLNKRKKTANASKISNKKSKLTYQEQLDLTALPKQIEQLEQQQSALHDTISQADFYQQPAEQVAKVQDQLKLLDDQLEQAYERWDELEQKQEA